MCYGVKLLGTSYPIRIMSRIAQRGMSFVGLVLFLRGVGLSYNAVQAGTSVVEGLVYLIAGLVLGLYNKKILSLLK